MRSIPPVVKNLILINVVMLLATYVFEASLGINLTNILGLHYVESQYFRPYQFVTHIFMHGGIMHLFFNMFALYMFGSVLEQVWGGKRFLFYYLVTGLGAAALHMFVNFIQFNHIISAINAFNAAPDPAAFELLVRKHFPEYYPQVYDKLLGMWSSDPKNMTYVTQANVFLRDLLDFRMDIPTVGASGAVFGVLLAFGMLFPNTQLMLLFPPIPIKAKYFVVGYGLIELYLGLNNPGSNIAHFAHLGGMAFGFFLIKYWQKNTPHYF